MSNFNLDYWPIVYFKSFGNDVDDESFDEYKKYYLSLLIKCKNNNEKMILVCNLNKITSYPMEFIYKQVEFSKQIFKFNQEYLKCVCILCENRSFKNILNLFFTLVKPASPYKLCKNFDKVDKYLFEVFNITFKSYILDKEIDEEISEEICEEISEEIDEEFDEEFNNKFKKEYNERVNEEIMKDL